MGRRKWYQCGCCSCFRANFKPNQHTELQNLPKPKEAEGTDGLPYIDSEKEIDILIVRSINPCIATNGIAHHTAKYEIMNRKIEPQLVIRRGQAFRIELNLSRTYLPEKDGISFIFSVEDEEKPTFGQGSLIAVPLLRRLDRSLQWSAVIEEQTDNNITVHVTPSPECIVGKWKLEVDTKIINDGAYSYSWSTGIYILYNPWCRFDQVYMKSDDWRDECVLEDVGLIWRGTANLLRPCIWKYAQFEENILECSLYLLKHFGKVHGKDAGDPVLTTRALSACVNSVDDDGAVMGNWSEKFSDGTAPTKWMGSMEILQKFYKKKKPVKYGQCWVFSGVLTTLCRAIGIPARTITNYASAHDTHSSLTVDYFLDEEGKVLEDLNSDSIWNFHVWNEAWMSRPDLSSSRDFGGWQALDATPQEESDGMYRCGPASVEAVRRGEIRRPYDVGFLYAEVNADKVYWRYTGPNQPLKLLRKDIFFIGKLISTKTPGKFEREDITSSYKHPERSTEERATMLKALRQSENLFSRYYLNENFNDIYFNFEVKEDIIIGQPFDVSVVMRNRNRDISHKVKVILRLDAVSYTGKFKKAVKSETFSVTILADTVHEVKLNVKYEEYQKFLLDQASFNVSCLATVENTKFEYYAQDDFRVRKPDIKILLHAKAIAGHEVAADVTLQNPLPGFLRKCMFLVEGPGLAKQLQIKLKDSVPVGEKAVGHFKFTPPSSGVQTIAAKFFCKELDDVDGFLQFSVQAPDAVDLMVNGL